MYTTSPEYFATDSGTAGEPVLRSGVLISSGEVIIALKIPQPRGKVQESVYTAANCTQLSVLRLSIHENYSTLVPHTPNVQCACHLFERPWSAIIQSRRSIRSGMKSKSEHASFEEFEACNEAWASIQNDPLCTTLRCRLLHC